MINSLDFVGPRVAGVSRTFRGRSGHWRWRRRTQRRLALGLADEAPLLVAPVSALVFRRSKSTKRTNISMSSEVETLQELVPMPDDGAFPGAWVRLVVVVNLNLWRPRVEINPSPIGELKVGGSPAGGPVAVAL